jgi:hypothetical protein
MKAAVFALAALVGVVASAQSLGYYQPAPCVPAEQPNPDFPLRVRVLGVNWQHNGWGFRGWGRANLTDGSQTEGLEYTFSCSLRFMYNAQADEFYQARWKKPHQKLEILMQQIGAKKPEKCELDVAERPHPYELGPPRQLQ